MTKINLPLTGIFSNALTDNNQVLDLTIAVTAFAHFSFVLIMFQQSDLLVILQTVVTKEPVAYRK